MANTLLRIGYISGSGGGGGISQYPDLASFPPTGSVSVLYFAIDTAKLYAWDGATYVEASPSLVTSVNTQVGDVVLDKSDVGLGNVDNTSDADKPISDDTQAALDLITDVTWTGDYNNGVTYAVGDGVMFNGASFRMIAAIGAAGYNPAGYPGNWLQVTDYVSANDIGLDQVDNTSDADKPISDATQLALDDKVSKTGDTMTGQLTIQDDSILIDASISEGMPNTILIEAGTIQSIVVNGDITSTSISYPYQHSIQTTDSVSTSNTSLNISAEHNAPILEVSIVNAETEMDSTVNILNSGLYVTNIDYTNNNELLGNFTAGSFTIETILADSSNTTIVGDPTGITLSSFDGDITTSPLMPASDFHVTVKKYVDAADTNKVSKSGDTMSGLLDITVAEAAALEANDIVIGNPWGAGYSVITGKDGSTDELYIQTADQLGTFAGNSSKQLVVSSGATQGANSGGVQIISGNAAVSGASGSVYIHSGDVAGATGFVTVKSGNSSSTSTGTAVLRSGDAAVNSGNTQVRSGNSVGNSGITSLFSGSSSSSNSGQVQVQSGAAAVASGNILISSGSAAIRGLVQIDGSKLDMLTSIDMNSSKITELLNPTDNQDAATKKYVDDADALKENLANKSIDGTLASNSDTLYPSEKAVKTYVDSTSGSSTANFEASTYYHELHVNYDFTGAISDGSPYRPFKTTQAAVNAAQLQTIGGNTAILIHLKNDNNIVENITITNAGSNLYIMPAVRNNTSSAPFKIIGSLTISGSQTTRVRVQDIEFNPTSGYALIINDTQGRHLFENCGFVNGSVAGTVGTGVNLTSTYRNFIEFVDCTIEGTLNIAGTPVAGSSVLMYRCKLSYANVIVNSANIAVGIYDTYGIYGLTHTAGALAITGLWGITQTGFFNSTATLTATNVLSLSNVSLQKPDLSFVALNKTGTCFYQLMNVHRGETADVLTGTRVVYGPTATDAGYKMGTSGNWPAAVSNVAGALDSLAANKIAVTQKAAINGVASLDGTGKVPLSQLPASTYAADVLEFANLAAFPIPGVAGIVYVALDTNKIYRWNTTVYTELSTAPVTSVNGKTNVVTLNAIDVPFSPTATILSTDVQSAIVEVQAASTGTAIYQDTKEPTGFINRTDSTTSFVDGSRLFTIAPVSASFSFYIKGTKFTKTTSQQITIPNFAGNHYIYFNTSGVLESTQIFSSDIIEQNAFVSVIYWNTDLNTHTYFAEERHGITMDGATHIYLHTTFGARYLSGLALQGFTPDGNGSLDAHAQFTADEGSIRDEDILLSSAAQAQIPILFRQGQLWRKKAADAFPLIYSGTAGYTGANGRIPYNQLVSGSWQLTQVSSANYVLVHFFATNDKENPIVGIQGIAQYNNAPQAKAAASTEITSLSGLPFAEFVAIGTVLFQSNTYTNTPDARVVSVNGATYIDFRGTQLYTPAGEATEHSLLSGLADDDHIQYHTDARGDIRYYTKAQVDTLITGITSPGDIDEKLFSISNSQALPDNVHNFVFSNSIVRAFEALVSIEIVATASLYETVKISGVQKGSDWDITLISSGDVSGVAFSITPSGQIQYTSDNVAGFVSGILKFRAITTSV